MISALGKGDKKIYVIPSKDLVVIRHGDDTGDAVLGPSSFDNAFWTKLMLAVKKKRQMQVLIPTPNKEEGLSKDLLDLNEFKY
ncbi:MAG: hypothetical protein IPH68_04620 [Chitinophagaceae bacterium]|nr:hypothetical protein [Chitinophagaceae bacterium]